MSSATQVSNGTARGDCVNKTVKSRRSWSAREEEVLLTAMKELVAQGWKSDNGFRAGYLNKLEEAMKKNFPTTDLKGMPHINSKVTTWKKSYNSLTHILKFSGVGFNAKGTFMVDCNNEQWENIVKTDENTRGMRYKSWPYHDDWKIIFGKDRATGDGAEDLMEAAHAMYRKIDLSQPTDDGSYHVSLDDIFENEQMADSVSQTHKQEDTPKAEDEVRVTRKKRKRHDTALEDLMFDALTRIGIGAKNRLDAISGRMSYDFDISKARKEVFSQLSAIQGLSQIDKFEITDLLTNEVERLDVFSSFPDDDKAAYVHYLLALKRK